MRSRVSAAGLRRACAEAAECGALLRLPRSPAALPPPSARAAPPRLHPTPLPVPMLKLDLVQTVAFAGLVLFAGYGIRRVVRPLARNNVPAPVIGGLLAAVAILLTRRAGAGLVQFDTTLQAPL